MYGGLVINDIATHGLTLLVWFNKSWLSSKLSNLARFYIVLGSVNLSQFIEILLFLIRWITYSKFLSFVC